MKYLSFFLLIILASSCTSTGVRQSLEDSPYRTSGVEQYFLPELPAWANVSPSGACFKSHSFQYFDFPKLSATYQLTYPQMIEFQAQYNDRVENYFRSTAVKFLKPVEESSFFSNTLEQVRGGVRLLKLPNVKEIDVIWLDSYIQLKKVNDLIKMAKSGKFDERLPILFSTCLSKQGLNQWLAENGLDEVGFYTLTANWLNPYGIELTQKAGLHIELKKLTNDGIKFNLIKADSLPSPTELVL